MLLCFLPRGLVSRRRGGRPLVATRSTALLAGLSQLCFCAVRVETAFKLYALLKSSAVSEMGPAQQYRRAVTRGQRTGARRLSGAGGFVRVSCLVLACAAEAAPASCFPGLP